MTPATRKILWTGGFDSTWLVIDALLAGDRVEAIVWRPPNGAALDPAKVRNEDAARARIAHGLPSTSQRRKLDSQELCSYEIWSSLRKHWSVLREMPDWQDTWNTQNPMLAALPEVTGPVEAGFVQGDRALAGPDTRSYLEQAGLVMPIAQRTKHELLADARQRGFEHLLRMTWSCEFSAQDWSTPWWQTKPCGECEPCQHRVLPQAGFGRIGE